MAPELDRRLPAFESPAFLNGTWSSSVAFLNGTRGISSLLPRLQGNAPHALLLGRADRAVDAGFRRVADGAGWQSSSVTVQSKQSTEKANSRIAALSHTLLALALQRKTDKREKKKGLPGAPLRCFGGRVLLCALRRVRIMAAVNFLGAVASPPPGCPP